MHNMIWNGDSIAADQVVNRDPSHRGNERLRTHEDDVHATEVKTGQVARHEVVDAADEVLAGALLFLGFGCLLLGARRTLGVLAFALALRTVSGNRRRGARLGRVRRVLAVGLPSVGAPFGRGRVVGRRNGRRCVAVARRDVVGRLGLHANAQGVLEDELGDDRLHADVDAGLENGQREETRGQQCEHARSCRRTIRRRYS